MLAKLAVRNIRRSAKDYAIYFITLVCGVAVFYAFNSIGSQQVMADVMANNTSFVELVRQFISMFSVVVACVLGFLVLYANRFLIRRRKREMGTYLLLGMRPSQVAGIVLLETLIVGVFSFAVGAVLGVGVSQGLSFVTAAMFDTVLDEYRFEFSEQALLFTAGCYALVFAVVVLFNTLQVSRCKLIKLLYARAANEKVSMRRLPVCVVAFVVAIGVIAAAYCLLGRNRLMQVDTDFAWSTVLMLVGTLLLFWSVAGFVIALVQRTRGVYFRGLAMFTMRQIASRINTAFVSLWAVCVLLFFGLTVFTSGMGLGQMFVQTLDSASPYDASIIANCYIDDSRYNESAKESDQMAREAAKRYRSTDGDMAQYFAAHSDGWSELVKDSVQVDMLADNDLTLEEVLDASGHPECADEDMSSANGDSPVMLVRESHMNNLLRMADKDPIDLGEFGYAVNNNVDLFQPAADGLVEGDAKIKVAGQELSPVSPCLSLATMNMSLLVDMLEIVVPDAIADKVLAKSGMPYASYLNITYADGAVEGDRMLQGLMVQALPVGKVQDMKSSAGNEETDLDWEHSGWPATMEVTKEQMHDTATSVRMLCTYLAIYIGFVLLIAVAAVLAIQQLSEASDSEQRYRVLAQLGCDKRQILGSLGTQVLVYFLAPLAVAVAHSVCAVSVLSSGLLAAWGIPISGAVAATAGLVLAVYGGYLMVTYLTARNVVRGALGKTLLG